MKEISMALHEKTSKWFNDCIKREKHRRNKYSQKEAQSNKKDTHSTAHYSQCCYCIKVFYDAKFLVKHVLRRHSDKLIELHENILSRTKSENITHDKQDLFEFLKAEFSDLKVDVDFIKKAFVEHMQEKKDAVSERKSDHKAFNNKKDSKRDSGPISIKSDSPKLKQPNVADYQISASDFQNLQVRVDKLFQMFQETMMLKEDVEKALALNEERICKSLKHELLSEIQNILSSHQKKNQDEYEARYIELQKQIDMLEKAVQVNSKKIESPDCFQEMQSKFESRIQNLLTGHSLFTSNTKKNKMNKSRISNNEQKLSLHKPKKRSRSVYTCKTVLNESSDCLGISKNQNLGTSFNQSKQKHFEGNLHKNKESLFFPSKNNQINEQERLHEFNSLIDNSENFTEKHLKGVKLIVEEKLRSLNIDPSDGKLQNEEFKKKMRLINSEKEVLEKKYKNFSQIHDKLDNHVEKIVKSKLKRNLPKRLRFSDSSCPTFPDSIDCGSTKKPIITAKKQESLGFISSFDPNAQGDSLPCKSFDVEKLAPIQENIENLSEASYANHHQLAYYQQNDDDSLKGYLPVSPIGDVAENISSKKYTDSLLQKTVEEMSDLSSLESDILEDDSNNSKPVV